MQSSRFSVAIAVTWLFSAMWLSTPQPAHGYPLNEISNDPATIATLHCRLLHLVGTPSIRLTQPILAELSSNPNTAKHIDDRTLDRLSSDFGNAPDFGFAVGRRWQTFSRRERREVNELFRTVIDEEHNLTKTTAINLLCPVKVLMSQDKPDSAYASTSFTLTTREGEPAQYLNVMYRMERPGSSGKWAIADIIINNKSIVQQHKLAINNYITQQGIKDIRKYFGLEEE